ncbi:hypothetical protein [Edaphobacter flagellatus]|uniref:hypothetical protein n=1 Tax=Edaphobacter flagellatus TaxID=1933044 RepID=UPI0021B3CCA1|nr:hypothetical protein [Edaphobacter flagellatus]
MAAEQFAEAKRSMAVWRSLYVLLVIQLLLLTSFIPVTAVAMYLMGENWFFFLTVPYVLVWLFVGYLLKEWECPLCHRFFLFRGHYGWTLPYHLSCVSCGLEIGDERAGDRSRSAAPWRRLHPHG